VLTNIFSRRHNSHCRIILVPVSNWVVFFDFFFKGKRKNNFDSLQVRFGLTIILHCKICVLANISVVSVVLPLMLRLLASALNRKQLSGLYLLCDIKLLSIQVSHESVFVDASVMTHAYPIILQLGDLLYCFQVDFHNNSCNSHKKRIRWFALLVWDVATVIGDISFTKY